MDNLETTAVIVLTGFAAALLIWIAAALWKSPYHPGHSVLYFADVLLTRVLWRTEIEGEFQIRPGQGAVIVCNHRSPVEPFFIQLVARRKVHWMVAREYVELPLLRGLFRTTGTIPTSRAGVDTAAVKQAIRLAREGELVGMLPEGRINDTEKFMISGRPGAALVALRARVPVVPVFISGQPYDGTLYGSFFMTARVRMVVGEPLDLSEFFDGVKDSDVLREVTKLMIRKIAALGGRPDFKPELAGRRWKPGSEE